MNNHGAIISFDPTNDSENVVWSFNVTDGIRPYDDLVYDTNNNLFYGTASGWNK